MGRSLLLVLALWPATAAALPLQRSGPYLGAGAGGFATVPLAGGFGWEANGGWWSGKYDEAYAIGHFTSLGAGLRQDVREGGPHTAAVVELRRGFDVIVAGAHGSLAAGPVFGDEVGVLAEAGAGAKLRLRFSGPFLGYVVRARVGVEHVAGDTVAHGGLTVGLEWSAPARKAPEERT